MAQESRLRQWTQNTEAEMSPHTSKLTPGMESAIISDWRTGLEMIFWHTLVCPKGYKRSEVGGCIWQLLLLPTRWGLPMYNQGPHVTWIHRGLLCEALDLGKATSEELADLDFNNFLYYSSCTFAPSIALLTSMGLVVNASQFGL